MTIYLSVDSIQSMAPLHCQPNQEGTEMRRFHCMTRAVIFSGPGIYLLVDASLKSDSLNRHRHRI
ncbi:hypothetical protein CBM2586_B90263 [Cupriavidus phytorum]|uniref:Uncharacterized protein n=1 Tax=Cupriavidus taiwanensis TaxID=164546 RepID=A0A976ACB4_9BURK|nr:hypothetical protein CBM2586_B90263 [Cupriavidus taiwanensis]